MKKMFVLNVVVMVTLMFVYAEANVFLCKSKFFVCHESVDCPITAMSTKTAPCQCKRPKKFCQDALYPSILKYIIVTKSNKQ
ncbi:unnamed protein product [Clavelina lepadiformis]|uniref:Late nodulin n=1 Tax=Clavelina lepadiformis TaxID=159417 RepID=A0ABP0GVK4_CLALP